MAETYPRKKMPIQEAMDIIVKGITEGMTIDRALQGCDRKRPTYNEWMKKYPSFRERVQFAKKASKGQHKELRIKKASDFADFREKYLGTQTFMHQAQWIDLIEGNPLKKLHSSMKFEKGDPRFILINCPPEHAKSMTLSIDYPVYRICKDPNVRIILVSKTQDMAKQFLYAIKQRLTHPKYKMLQGSFAPAEGYKGDSSVWKQNIVYLGDTARDTSEKDPTLNAIGIGQQIYGARADLIILDDCVVLSNSNQYESQIRWIQQEVITRLGPGGRLIIAGTRVDSIDLYRELRNPERYPDNKCPWTYLAQPAVLEFNDDPKKWVTLWPESNLPWIGTDDQPGKNGLYPRWDGPRLYARRGILDAKTWSMVYQNQDVSDDAVFPVQMVRQCINGNRSIGLLQKGNQYHRKEGMDGLYVVCSMDPAMTGDTATIVLAVDPQTQKRYVLDANRMPSPTPQAIKNLIKAWTEKYNPNCWVIEKNAFQLYLTRDEEIRSFLANRGTAMMEHYTSTNKLDPDFGVASLAPLFSEEMIELPSSHKSEGCKALVEQLITWRPGVKGKDLKMDLPMSLWFAELRVRLVVEQRVNRANSHYTSRYMPKYRKKMQNVIYLDEYEEAS